MYEQLRLRQMRRDFNKLGWALLVYMGIMNVAVMIVSFLDGVMGGIRMMTDRSFDMDDLTEQMSRHAGWGYLLTILIGVCLLLIWKKPKFVSQTVMAKGHPLRPARFFGVLLVFMSTQLVFMLISYLTDWAWNGFAIGLSESVTGSAGSFSMFLYIAIGAPITEELLFRGVVLRTMEPYGKKFAIIASAFLFGAFHGNLSQGPFAFLVGMILAYVTLEYNIVWAMVLHMINNMLLTETLPTLGTLLPPGLGDALVIGLIVLCSVGALIVLIARQNKIIGYLRRLEDQPNCARAFWTAPGMIVLIAVLGVTILLSILLMFVPM